MNVFKSSVLPRITSRRTEWFGEVATAFYILMIALIARSTGLSYVMFPELGALSHDIMKRPYGAWAKAPLMLIVTPVMAGVIGTFVTQHLPYGLVSVLLTVGGTLLIIWVLRSPIAPAISAGLLPLTLGESSWWYPPCLLIGLILLAAISLVRRWVMPPSPASSSDLTDNIVNEAAIDYSWIPFFLVFLVIGILLVGLTGWRFLLFPPLVVMGFEMFAHTANCPWAHRPFILPITCTLNATAGVIFVCLFGAGPLAATCNIVFGIAILRVFDLHVPPAIAVGLLPFVMPTPNYEFPIVVAAGTLLLTILFMVWRSMLNWRKATSV